MRYLASAILWCISASAQSPVPVADSSPTAKPEDKCSIEGTVVNAVTGEPVKKARLFLLGSARYATTTDSAGHFLMDEIDAGRYSLTADHSGFPGQIYSPRGGKPKQGSVLELAAGQDLKEIVFKLVPSAVIAGRVLDEDGDPLSRVSVGCLGVSYHDGKRQLSEQAKSYTNEFGEFRLVVEWARKCAIKATHPDIGIDEALEERPVAVARAKARVANERYVPTYYPNTANPDSASILDVPPDAQIGAINVILQRSRTVRIKGHVTISPATCADQTFVYLSPEAGKPVKASPQGLFQMNGVLPGSYLLDARCHLDEKPYYARIPIEIRDANIEGIELALQPIPSVHGHVSARR